MQTPFHPGGPEMVETSSTFQHGGGGAYFQGGMAPSLGAPPFLSRPPPTIRCVPLFFARSHPPPPPASSIPVPCPWNWEWGGILGRWYAGRQAILPGLPVLVIVGGHGAAAVLGHVGAVVVATVVPVSTTAVIPTAVLAAAGREAAVVVPLIIPAAQRGAARRGCGGAGADELLKAPILAASSFFSCSPMRAIKPQTWT